MKVGDIVIIKVLPDWGECEIKQLYGEPDKIYYEVSPLAKTEGVAFLMGLTKEHVELIREAKEKPEA
jgi:hypothetical protein